MKTEQPIVRELLKNTHTRADLYYRIELIKEFFEVLFFEVHQETPPVKEALEKYLHDKGEHEATISALTKIPEKTLEALTRETLYAILGACKKEVQGLKALTFYTPVSFPPEERERLGEWARQNIDPLILLVLLVDPRVAGGCAFVKDGVYHDFSFRYFFNMRKENIKKTIQDRYKNYGASRSHSTA